VVRADVGRGGVGQAIVDPSPIPIDRRLTLVTLVTLVDMRERRCVGQFSPTAQRSGVGQASPTARRDEPSPCPAERADDLAGGRPTALRFTLESTTNCPKPSMLHRGSAKRMAGATVGDQDSTASATSCRYCLSGPGRTGPHALPRRAWFLADPTPREEPAWAYRGPSRDRSRSTTRGRPGSIRPGLSGRRIRPL
jgi:hypothetical protein